MVAIHMVATTTTSNSNLCITATGAVAVAVVVDIEVVEAVGEATIAMIGGTNKTPHRKQWSHRLKQECC